jgi:2,4-didehydro-3-deoxy-L-rhamnonate hydrolase
VEGHTKLLIINYLEIKKTMKLFRYGPIGQEKPGICIENIHYDLSAVVDDINERFFEDGGIDNLQNLLDNNQVILPKIADNERIASCVARPSKIICIGLNYADHAKESGMELPKEPVVFLKASSALLGPNDTVLIPKNSEKTDWEVEFAIVIGKKASYVSEAEAMDYVAGYCTHNDLSERAFQLERGGQWDKGKGCDTFAPLGPYLVSKSEIADIHNLDLSLSVNGTQMQKSNTNQLIFKVPFIIHYLSQFMSLLPGDVISTGTPAGVGLGFKPPIYLKPGDIIELEVAGLGKQRQVVQQA